MHDEICKSVMNGEVYDKILEMIGGGTPLAIILHGSHLYGLDNEDSDLDIKVVYIPAMEDILIGNIPRKSKTWSSGKGNSKNGKDDVDIEVFSIYTFINLLKKSDSGCVSMLYAPIGSICMQTPLWQFIIKNRRIFIAKDMIGLLGFIKKQVHKYCDKGVRLEAATKVLSVLEKENGEDRLVSIWDKLPLEKYLKFKTLDTGLDYYEVCGKLCQSTITIDMAKNIISKIVSEYGDRSIKTMNNKGLDWKAISHAFRVATELTEIYERGSIIYPLKNREYIKRIKNGELDFDSEVLPKLNTIMDDIEHVASLSDFPQKLNHAIIDGLLFSVIKEFFNTKDSWI